MFNPGPMIVSELDRLIQGLTWLETGVLSPLLVPTEKLETIMSYINTHLEHNATMKVNMVPSTLGDFHKMISFFMTRMMGRLINTLNIPLTSYNGPFKVFEVKAVLIRVPNSQLDSLLEVPHQYVAIHEESGALIALSADDAKKVLKSGHYLIWYPVVRVDTNRSCTIAIFRNNAKMTKELCTYVVRLTIPWFQQ